MMIRLDYCLSASLLLSRAKAQINLFASPFPASLIGSPFGQPGANATFDYVVVGGGNAGLTIATRLAEDPSIRVAVIEAGGFYEIDDGNASVVPGQSTFYTGADPTNYQPLIDWGFSTEPQAVGEIQTALRTSHVLG